jgi:hypothetical protein
VIDGGAVGLGVWYNGIMNMTQCLAVPVLFVMVAVAVGDGSLVIDESFEDFDPARFLTPIPNEHTEVRDGALWTHGGPEKGYPPLVYMPVEGTDLTISFRYRQLGDGEYVWLLVDGDDSFGGTDHVFRVKLMRDGVQLQIDGHTLDADDPKIQTFGGPRIDKVSGSYRTNELLPIEKLDLSDHDWHQVNITFLGESAIVTLDESKWKQSLERPGLKYSKQKLLWMLKGGEAGIELDDIRVGPIDAAASDER